MDSVIYLNSALYLLWDNVRLRNKIINVLLELYSIRNQVSLCDRINRSLKLIRDYEPDEGYYVAFSGGKDSIVVLDLIKRAGVKFDAHFTFTTIDPPEVLEFIRCNYPDVIWERPKKSMFKLIESKGFPPTRNMRYCCGAIKEIHGTGRVVVTGIRWSESASRSHRERYERSKKNKKTYYLNPIIDWSDKQVWDYIFENGLTYPVLYDYGYERIGCIMCPLQKIANKERDIERYPKFYKAYMRCFSRMLKSRKSHMEFTKLWKTPFDVMEWWIYEGKPKK